MDENIPRHGLRNLRPHPPAELARDEPIQLREIAARRGTPANYLAKIFRELAHAHIVPSFRGARRGFLLALPPERVSLRMILEATEGPLNAEECLLDLRGDLGAIRHCRVYAGLRGSLGVFAENLSRITLAHLVQAAGQAGPPTRIVELPGTGRAEPGGGAGMPFRPPSESGNAGARPPTSPTRALTDDGSTTPGGRLPLRREGQ